MQDYYSDNEEMLAKLAAGATGYDIIVPTGNAVESLIRQDALRPLDKSKIAESRRTSSPSSSTLVFDPGNRYSVPYAYSITLIGYNDEKMRGAGPADRHLGGDLRAEATWRSSRARSPCSTASAS